ncbi:hypothetical protein AKG95_19200 [Janthinobacterium lividum]|uniref:BREX system P-loop protein BrxC n=1 Tax=Janthinobacterium lividum TaxID=29581 RepID=A0A1S1U4D3_9BURK|nr:BREX system P-loop protein BrxC [Janthinobacterium lividum]OHV95317.1 hypothetical protein AKG95_19200 [Janthinobacterium lividum]
MLNREIYVKSPEQNRLANNGVAEVSEDQSDAALAVLRYELESFVCDGQYEKGLETILALFLGNLTNKAEQPGIWISGFYGSGKSHLAKMLRNLWTDFQFADGATARGLAKLPTTVLDYLRELRTQGKRHGGLHAAAGKLGAGAGDNVRLALLGIIFKSKGLPEQYPQAQFVMWLKREGILETVENALVAAGRSLVQELPHLYVSGHLAKALMKAQPGFADSDLAARQFIKAQFPQVMDITNDQLVAAITDALSQNGKFPLTLVVLDEMQQYIGSDTQKAYLVQEVTETLCKHFNGLLLFVGTGQSALSGMANLQRIMARFPVPVMLGDWDVENVTRQIILAKKPSAQPEIEKVWRSNLGEISRHLRGTKLEHVTDDEAVMTPDYPLLPVRRRFWERVLRTIDTTGTVSQLRSQLRVVHEAVMATADVPLGHVVSGDFLYDQIAANLVSTAQLPREVFESVQKFSAGDASSNLKGKLLKLIYLINKLPADAALDLGLKATEDVLADLLVTDLKAGSSELRKALPPLLVELQQKDRLVMALDGPHGAEYRLQTRESSAWYDEFRSQEAELKAAPQRIEVQRAELFKARFRQTLSKVRAVQGKSNEVRQLSVCFDETLPKDNDKTLYLWIQDGWQTEEKSVLAEARAKGPDNPTIFAFMPAQGKTDFANAIVALEAAKGTLNLKGAPSTEEGRDAQRSMESRSRNAEKEIADLVDKLFATVKVFQAGGHEVTEGNDLLDKLNRAAKASIVRLYRDFDVADQEGWGKVVEEARKGNAEALKAVGHTQEADKHLVCQKVKGFIGSGKKGSEIRDNFENPYYGWSRDAIDGALFILLTTGHLRATDASGKPVDAKSLDRNKLTQANFRQEMVTISPVQKIKIRGLFTALGIPCQPNDELAKAPFLIAKLKSLAEKAGGAAPQPAIPSLEPIDALEGYSGNDLLNELFKRSEELTKFAKQWEAAAKASQAKLPIWHQLTGLVEHAKNLGPYAGIKAEMSAIIAQRSLLVEPDPVRPVLDNAAEVLRHALNAKLIAFQDEYTGQTAALAVDANWKQLKPEQQQQLIRDHHIDTPRSLDLSTAEALADALDDCHLQRWGERTQAMRTRFDSVRLDAAKLLKPNVIQVHLPKRTLNSAEEVKAWLSEVEALLLDKVQAGPVAL